MRTEIRVLIALSAFFALSVSAQCAEPGAVFAFPNPARESARIRFPIENDAGRSTVRIFDLEGGMIREIQDEALERPEPGLRRAVWDLKNSIGSDVAPGVYVFSVSTVQGDGREIVVRKKVAVLR